MEHEPHSFVIYVPGQDEATVRLTVGVCSEGTCRAFEIEDYLEKFVDRWAACGIKAESIPGVHWWEDTPTYMTMLNLAYLHRATHEGNQRLITHHKMELATMARTKATC